MYKREQIESFTGKYDFLSNFYPSKITLGGIEYPTVEHAYQAQKTKDKNIRKMIAKCATPGLAKKMGRSVQLRSDWQKIDIQVMLNCLYLKFRTHHKLKDRLLVTNYQMLIEGNDWGDDFWGVDLTKGGHNILGKLLMSLRNFFFWETYRIDKYKLKGWKKVKDRKKITNQYDKEGNFIKQYSSVREAGKSTGIDANLIGKCCNKKQKTAGGFKWRFEENNG